jgi:hypothetical protein
MYGIYFIAKWKKTWRELLLGSVTENHSQISQMLSSDNGQWKQEVLEKQLGTKTIGEER